MKQPFIWLWFCIFLCVDLGLAGQFWPWPRVNQLSTVSCQLLDDSRWPHSHVWQLIEVARWSNLVLLLCSLQLNSLDFFFNDGGSAPRKQALLYTALIKTLLTSHLLMSLWPRLFIWLILVSIWEGTTQRHWFWECESL